MKKIILALAAASALAVAAPSFAATGGSTSSTPAASSSTAATPAAAPTHLSLLARVQTKLKTLNIYSGAVNGRRDAATIAAIRSYQTQNHLAVNGRIDAATRRSLGI